MRAVLSAVLLAALAASAPSALAQDEGDHLEQMVNAVKERKERSLEQVMTAPAVVQDRMRQTDLDIGMDGDDRERKSKPVVSPFDREEDDDTWQLVVAGSVVLLGGAFFVVTRKAAQR